MLSGHIHGTRVDGRRLASQLGYAKVRPSCSVVAANCSAHRHQRRWHWAWVLSFSPGPHAHAPSYSVAVGLAATPHAYTLARLLFSLPSALIKSKRHRNTTNQVTYRRRRTVALITIVRVMFGHLLCDLLEQHRSLQAHLEYGAFDA
jgi:hypothetical protein